MRAGDSRSIFNLPTIMPTNSNTAAAVLHPDLAPDTSIKILGLGGIGSIVARYGAVFLASLDTAQVLVANVGFLAEGLLS